MLGGLSVARGGIEGMPSGSLSPDDAAAVRDLARRVSDADGVAALSEATLLSLGSGDERDEHVVRRRLGDDHGPLVAYAHVRTEPDGPAWAEITVDPAARRQGLGGGLLDDVRQRHPQARVWAHGDLPAARALAERRDLSSVRDLWRMERAVDGDPVIEQPEAPTGFAIRAFRLGQDEQAWLDVNSRAFSFHPEQGRMTLADLHERMAEPWFDPAGLLLIEDVRGQQPVLAASHWTKVEPEQTEAGEVYVVAVDPQYQGHGLGRVVTAAGLAHLAGRGVRTIDLYVEGDNTPAIATYRRWGFERVARDVMYAASSPTPDRLGQSSHG